MLAEIIIAISQKDFHTYLRFMGFYAWAFEKKKRKDNFKEIPTLLGDKEVARNQRMEILVVKNEILCWGIDSFYLHPDSLHLEWRSVMCNGAEENQAHRCDPYGLRVQEQPLFLVCSSITIFTSVGLGP